MDSLATTQHIQIIKNYYKNGNFATTTYRASIGDYGLHNRPTMQAIGKIVKKFEETEVVPNIERPVHHRFNRSAENIAIRTVLQHIMAYFAFRSTLTSI